MATALQQAVLWIWHTPSAIAAALERDAVHIAMHASLLAAALVFWSAVLRPASGRYWGSIAALLVTFKISGIVCVGFLLQTQAVYEAYRNGVDDDLFFGPDATQGWFTRFKA
ncbi:MAG TPA: cytochrome c oxidase assembly protein, partial [Burkholderiales bacterium]|nr:cytochrome c oxidase assembly protein [Burkholderiales bacterium]